VETVVNSTLQGIWRALSITRSRTNHAAWEATAPCHRKPDHGPLSFESRRYRSRSR
jgi:hypothetical protein